MATTIRVLSDLVTAVECVSSSTACRGTTLSSEENIGTERTGVGQDSSALGNVELVALESTATVFQNTGYINYYRLQEEVLRLQYPSPVKPMLVLARYHPARHVVHLASEAAVKAIEAVVTPALQV